MKKHAALAILAFAVSAGCAQLPFFSSTKEGGLAIVGSNACAGNGTGCPIGTVTLASVPKKAGDTFKIEGGATVTEVEIRIRPVIVITGWPNEGARLATTSVTNQVFSYSGTLPPSLETGGNTLKLESGKGYQFLVGSGQDFKGVGMFSLQ